jgi:HD superfamily phosphohydrolase YqeK
MSVRDPNSVEAHETLRTLVSERLSGDRLEHVASVVQTIREIAIAGDWSEDVIQAAIRAGWLHDILWNRDEEAWEREITGGGEAPDPWALRHAPILLHAQAAAVWARRNGETDPQVLEAVRYHPTAHPNWGPVGRLLYVADFSEPCRPFAADRDTAALRALAADGETGLREASVRVLRNRMTHHLDRGMTIHPLTLEAWNAWRGAL